MSIGIEVGKKTHCIILHLHFELKLNLNKTLHVFFFQNSNLFTHLLCYALCKFSINLLENYTLKQIHKFECTTIDSITCKYKGPKTTLSNINPRQFSVTHSNKMNF